MFTTNFDKVAGWKNALDTGAKALGVAGAGASLVNLNWQMQQRKKQKAQQPEMKKQAASFRLSVGSSTITGKPSVGSTTPKLKGVDPSRNLTPKPGAQPKIHSMANHAQGTTGKTMGNLGAGGKVNR